ncbi:MAG TPA: helix-turn-helix transcriptional regulator [Pyrinomonadaceae bacterium]|jgi:transcriptional regulator with XRE-family HTH domain
MSLTPEKVISEIRSHFDSVSESEFKRNVEKFCLETSEDENMEGIEKGQDIGQLLLFPHQNTMMSSLPLHLEAYLACALTGLTEEQRQLMFQLSDVVAMVCEGFDISLYEPRKKTDPVHNIDVPDTDVFHIDRERVLQSDLLIHLCHYPSTGAGEELAFAYDAMVPIILISHSNTRVSRMITGIPGFKLEIKYTEPEEMRLQLRQALLKIRPILEERKVSFSKYEANIVGERVRSLREELGLTREEVASKLSPPLDIEALRQLEESVDKVSNPSLAKLRQLAVVLKTTVADIVEPSVSDFVISKLEELLNQKMAARGGIFIPADRKRLLRRTLLHMIEVLDRE